MAAKVRVHAVNGYTVTPPAIPPRVMVYGVVGFGAVAPSSAPTVRVFAVNGTSGAAHLPPFAFAGTDVADVEPWTIITLDGAGSAPAEGAVITGWLWSQIAGTPVAILIPGTQTPSVEVAGTVAGETATFALQVTDSYDGLSNLATVNVTTLPATELVVRGGVLVAYKPMSITG